ncbi:WG repeat-containing protein [Spirochaeta cellobiosiphila]|uniref:WG repeat-containing protein n=1 Tax=Spirochaeta cellobiosiphila TaxID=504483 RepID=UPI00040D7667|nr:WG repeat-containing protein [Spirochaeta cellobiosiphila]
MRNINYLLLAILVISATGCLTDDEEKEIHPDVVALVENFGYKATDSSTLYVLSTEIRYGQAWLIRHEKVNGENVIIDSDLLMDSMGKYYIHINFNSYRTFNTLEKAFDYAITIHKQTTLKQNALIGYYVVDHIQIDNDYASITPYPEDYYSFYIMRMISDSLILANNESLLKGDDIPYHDKSSAYSPDYHDNGKYFYSYEDGVIKSYHINTGVAPDGSVDSYKIARNYIISYKKQPYLWDDIQLVADRNDDGLFGYKDENGEWVIDPIFYWGNPFNHDIAFVMEKEDYSYSVINKKGEFLSHGELDMR